MLIRKAVGQPLRHPCSAPHMVPLPPPRQHANHTDTRCSMGRWLVETSTLADELSGVLPPRSQVIWSASQLSNCVGGSVPPQPPILGAIDRVQCLV